MGPPATGTAAPPVTEPAAAPSAAAPNQRVDEALAALRYKDVRSTTLERIRLTARADAAVEGLAQPLQLGEGLYLLLDTITVPVAPWDLLLGRMPEQVPDEEGEAFFQATLRGWNGRGIPPWMPDGGHECFAWDRLLTHGLSGLEAFARGQRDQRSAAGESGSHRDFLGGAVRIYQAFRHYARRCAAAAQDAGLAAPAAPCAAAAERPPETFAEAVQLMWLVGHVYCTMLASNPTLTFGRMDELLLPFYRADLGRGRMTHQEAGEQGLERLTHLLRTYLNLGGLQVQLSFADAAMLRDAQIHPERHRDLMVRITGYSAAFVDMTRAAQDEIIRREEMGQ